MTVIIAHKTDNGLIFASDTQCSNDSDKGLDTIEKVFVNNDVIFGIAGSIKLNNDLRYRFKFETPKNIVDYNFFDNYVYDYFRRKLQNFLSENGCLDDKEEVDGEIIFGIGDRLFIVQSDCSILEPVNDFYSIGTGYAFATGALSALTNSKLSIRNKLKKAIEIAGTYTTSCNKEVRIYDYTF